jgi:hypothetical protein
LKTAFKILPEVGSEDSVHLLIEAGWESISFLYFSKSPLKIQGLLIYQFEKNITAMEMADVLNQFFTQENLPRHLNCYISYNYKETTMIPAAFYNESALADILDSIYTPNKTSSYFSEKEAGLEAIIAYRVDSRIESVLNQHFPQAIVHSSISLQLPVFKEKSNFLYCIIYQNNLKVISFKQQELQLVQFFDYTTPTDVAYHLLNVCTQHDLSPQDICLTISGFIDKKSNLYEELDRYFLNIQLEELESDVAVAHAISQYPVHFFSHLILLAKCVS